MTENVSPEMVGKLAQFVRLVSECEPIEGNSLDETLVMVAKALSAELPAPVDPAVFLARSVCAETLQDETFNTGEFDAGDIMRCAVAAFRSASTLATQGDR